MSSGTTHFHEMRVFVRLCVAAHRLFARTDEVQREKDGPSSLLVTACVGEDQLQRIYCFGWVRSAILLTCFGAISLEPLRED